MTLENYMERFDGLVSNGFGQWDKVSWLSQLDHDIREHEIDTHEGGPTEPFIPYDLNHDDERFRTQELIAGEPYLEMYDTYLESQIHYYNQEIDRYNNANERYRAARTDFNKDYNRKHKPKSSKMIYW